MRGREVTLHWTRSLFSDLLVLGTGSQKKINPAITGYLHRKGISLEIQDTVSPNLFLLIMTFSSSLSPSLSLMRVPHSIFSLTREASRSCPHPSRLRTPIATIVAISSL